MMAPQTELLIIPSARLQRFLELLCVSTGRMLNASHFREGLATAWAAYSTHPRRDSGVDRVIGCATFALGCLHCTCPEPVVNASACLHYPSPPLRECCRLGNEAEASPVLRQNHRTDGSEHSLKMLTFEAHN